MVLNTLSVKRCTPNNSGATCFRNVPFKSIAISNLTADRAKRGRRCFGVCSASGSVGDQSFGTTASLSAGAQKLEEFAARPGRKCMFKAEASGVVQVEEGTRKLKEYMSLPPSQYSVLDAEKVKRIGEKTFKCELAQIKFLGIDIQPVLTAEVDVKPDGRGTIIKVIDAEIRGVGAASDTFMIVSENDVTLRDAEVSPNVKEISSESSVAVHIILPGWLPFSAIATERTGNFVMHQVLEQVVPRFLNQLKKDYQTWAEGDDSRKAMSSGMFDIDVSGTEAPLEAK